MRKKVHTMKGYYKLTMAHLRHWLSPFMDVWGRECHKFYSQISDLFSEKRNLPKSVVANWVRSKVCLVTFYIKKKLKN